MKIGLGLYRESLTSDNFRFARQAGATHIVAHLTNYFRGRDPSLSTGNEKEGWGDCSTDALWDYEDFSGLVKTVRDNGLEIAAIEHFSPRFWSDVLLGGPDRARQIEGLKRLVRDAGRASIPCIGYNFSMPASGAGRADRLHAEMRYRWGSTSPPSMPIFPSPTASSGTCATGPVGRMPNR